MIRCCCCCWWSVIVSIRRQSSSRMNSRLIWILFVDKKRLILSKLIIWFLKTIVIRNVQYKRMKFSFLLINICIDYVKDRFYFEFSRSKLLNQHKEKENSYLISIVCLLKHSLFQRFINNHIELVEKQTVLCVEVYIGLYVRQNTYIYVYIVIYFRCYVYSSLCPFLSLYSFFFSLSLRLLKMVAYIRVIF